jgi:hypothetical protein
MGLSLALAFRECYVASNSVKWHGMMLNNELEEGVGGSDRDLSYGTIQALSWRD